MHKAKILVVDDEVEICALLEKFLTQNGYIVTTAFSGTKALSLLNRGNYDLVLTDFRLNDIDGMDVLRKTKEISPETQVIVMTGYSDVKMAVQLIKNGAFDYVAKPLFPDEILLSIQKALQLHAAPDANKIVRYSKDENLIVGQSKKIKEVYRQISLVAPTNYSIIIFGESGTGKESAAREIHNLSMRRNKPFVALDCGVLSTELAASELFGHEKGAYTGALGAKEGLFEIANTGTLFLDEVANLSHEVQTSLLRVLQERKVRRLGSTKEKDVDIRIVSASNENLYNAVQQGKFREDLYHRLNEFSMNLPPLRERDHDIMLLANHFMKETARELNKKVTHFSENVVRVFITYNWPGNVRELKNVVKRAVLMTENETVQLCALPSEISGKNTGGTEKDFLLKTEVAANMPALKKSAMEAECETIMNALKKVNFNKSKAARLLDIDRKTLYNKMKSFNI